MHLHDVNIPGLGILVERPRREAALPYVSPRERRHRGYFDQVVLRALKCFKFPIGYLNRDSELLNVPGWSKWWNLGCVKSPCNQGVGAHNQGTDLLFDHPCSWVRTHLRLGTRAAEEGLGGEGRRLHLLLRGVPLQAQVEHRGRARGWAQRGRGSVGQRVGGRTDLRGAK